MFIVICRRAFAVGFRVWASSLASQGSGNLNVYDMYFGKDFQRRQQRHSYKEEQLRVKRASRMINSSVKYWLGIVSVFACLEIPEILSAAYRK